jgi:hypothetical protein
MPSKNKLMKLIQNRMKTFEKTPNIYPLPNHVTSSRIVNTLEIESLRSLKVSIDRIYKNW